MIILELMRPACKVMKKEAEPTQLDKVCTVIRLPHREEDRKLIRLVGKLEIYLLLPKQIKI